MRTVLLATVMLALCGCASTGTSTTSKKIDAAQLHEVRKGQSTFADILKRFGRPNVLSRNWDGTQTAAYANTEGRSDIAALFPLVGTLAAGTGGDSVIFYFDTGGVLTDYKMTQSTVTQSAQAGAEGITKRAPEPDDPTKTKLNRAPVRADTVQQGKQKSELPFWLPSEIRDPRF